MQLSCVFEKNIYISSISTYGEIYTSVVY